MARPGDIPTGPSTASNIPDPRIVATAEACWTAAGRIFLLYDAAMYPRRSRIQVVADGQDTFDLDGTSRSVGGQLIHNGDFSEGSSGWRLESSPTAELGVDLAPEWTLRDGHTAYVRDADAASEDAILEYVGESDDGFIPVRSGRHYQLSLYAAAHRCIAEVTLEFLDTEAVIVSQARRRIDPGSPGGPDVRAYDHVAFRSTAPAGAEWARLRLLKSRTAGQAADSYVFVADVGLISAGAEVLATSVVPEAYAALARWESPTILSASLPPQLADGMAHDLVVIDPDEGRPVTGSPLRTEPVATFDGGVEEVNGSLIKGWARHRQDPSSPAEVAIEIDDVEVARVIADAKHKTGPHGFEVVIPEDLLDGRGHRILVRALPGGYIIGQSVRPFPRALTPWPALQEHASAPLPSDLAPAAAYRYRSMQADLEAQYTASDRGSVRLPQLGQAHHTLVRGFERNRDFEPLLFPTHEEPLVSVVIPVHNKRAVTYNCLAALLFAHNKAPFEIIVVDDASTDETVDLPGLIDGVTFVRQEQNRGFVHSCNAGAGRARGRYITFLNNDTEPTAGWLDEMVMVFRNYADVGLVGSRMLYPDGRLQEAGGIVWSNGDPWNYGRAHNPYSPQFGYTRQADYLSGASLTIDRETWEEVGGFSEEFAPAYFEDTDLAFKVRAVGRKTVYAPMSIVFHYEGVSNGTDTAGSGLKRYQEVNRPKFKAKWAHALLDQPEMGLEPRLAADQGTRRRALFIDHNTPQPDRSAGGYAEIQEMRLIQSLGFKVTFFPENMAWLGASTEYLQRMGVEVIHAPFCFTLEELLEQRGSEFDLVYVTRFDAALRAIEPVRRLAPQAKIAFTLADLHFLRQIRDAISGDGSVELAVETRHRELRAIREADVTLSYSEVEHAVIMSHNLADGDVAMAPWVADVEESVPAPEEREGIAFLGSFGHPPNVQAVEFFCEQVMPLVRKGRPGTTFHVYGSGWPDEVRDRLGAEDIVFEGFVDSINEAYGQCRVAVAPLVTGAGLKGKVVDALTHGVPQVLSPVALEGTGLRHGSEALVAETPEAWAESVIALCVDDQQWQSVSAAARAYARESYRFERGQELMRKALETVGIYTSPSKDALVVKDARPDWSGEDLGT